MFTTFVHHTGYRCRGNGDDDKVDRMVDFGEGGIGLQPLDGVMFRVDRVECALEAVLAKVAKHLAANGVLAIGSTNDRHR